MDLKNAIGITAIILTFVGYIPYLRDILKKKTRPHIYSWFLWGFITLVAFALQSSDKAGIGSIVTLVAAIMCLIVCVLGFLQKGKRDITRIDTIFLILAFIATIIWIFAKQPVLSILLITTVDLLGFAPTIRKSWNNPHSETLSFYLLNTLRFTLATISLNHYSILTTLYPIVWAIANGLFAIMISIRRKDKLFA